MSLLKQQQQQQQTNKSGNYMFCSTSVKKKIVQKDTNILLQKKIKERDASAKIDYAYFLEVCIIF